MINHIPPPDLQPGSRRIGPARRAVLSLLDRVGDDGIVVVSDGRSTHHGRTPGPAAPTVTVHDGRTWPTVVRQGSAGLGEAWFREWWDTDDLVGLLRTLIRSSERLDSMRSALASLSGPVTDPLRRLRRADPDGDRSDIVAHYDLSNDFFSLVLDPTMAYSCALFSSPEQRLEDAQVAKFESWCSLLGLDAGTDVVEIGSGWGGFALHAAGRHGSRVTTTTVSQAQYDAVVKRVADAGLGDLVEVRHDDYRHLDGTHDRLVSIEMIEAVHWRDYGRYFATCERLLRPDGLGGIQAIVIADQRYERAKNTTDFIKQWVFPGGMLPSITALTAAMTDATSLRVVELRDIGAHYAETLYRWRRNLLANSHRLGALGLDRTFERLFEFYLSYCEAAFRERHVSVVQLVFAKPGWRGALT